MVTDTVWTEGFHKVGTVQVTRTDSESPREVVHAMSVPQLRCTVKERVGISGWGGEWVPEMVGRRIWGGRWRVERRM